MTPETIDTIEDALRHNHLPMDPEAKALLRGNLLLPADQLWDLWIADKPRAKCWEDMSVPEQLWWATKMQCAARIIGVHPPHMTVH